MCNIIFKLYNFIYFLGSNELKYIKYLLCPQNLPPHLLNHHLYLLWTFKGIYLKTKKYNQILLFWLPTYYFLKRFTFLWTLLFPGTYWSQPKRWWVGQHLSFSGLTCHIIAFVLLLFVCSYLCHISPAKLWAPQDLSWASPSHVPACQ